MAAISKRLNISGVTVKFRQSPFDLELPEVWLNPFTAPGLSNNEQLISLELSREQLKTIKEGMSHYLYDRMNYLPSEKDT